MARLKICLLGAFRASIDGIPITQFESNKVRALLAYLAVESSRPHSREKLADLFWPDMTARKAKANLSRAVYNIRLLIQDHQAGTAYLLRTSEAIQFNPDSDYWLDVNLVQEKLGDNPLSAPKLSNINPAQLEAVQAVVDLFQGDFLEGITFDSSLAFDEWVMIVRQRLVRQVLAGLHLLSDYYSAQGDFPQALACAWRQVELDPLDERAGRQLMGFLADIGQRNQALTQFERLQVMLAEELGVAPEPETVALRDRIRNEETLTLQDRSSSDNLPGFLTPLIGRKAELSELRTLIDDPGCRLLTILGPGGSGKTRLALEVARSSLEHFVHGVYFVPLNPVLSPESILPSITDALGLPRGAGDDIQDQLGNYLRKKNILFLLDGFEHLLAGANLLAELLRQAREIKILITSRTCLNLKSEHLYMLSGMRYPQDGASEAEILDSDAVQMLVAGLQRTRPRYEPLPEELHDLHQVCQKVQGMPLGILLAASWGSTLGVDEINEQVNRGLDFLAADWADVPARQRSLRATFDFTWGLLSALEQAIFESLSVFRGAFTRQAARAVSNASPHELRKLVDRSLLWSKNPGWYEVHELLRQYGREKLAQTAHIETDVCARHSEYYLAQLVRLGVGLKSAGQVTSMESIDLEHENIRAAWNWAASQGSVAQLEQAVDALCLYYDLNTRYADGASACRIALEGLSQVPNESETWLTRALVSTWLSRFRRLLGQPEVAYRTMEEALNQLESAKAASYQAQVVSAFIHFEHGNSLFHKDRAAAAVCYRHSLELYRKLNASWGSAKTLARLGLLAHHSGSFQEAVRCYTESLELYRANGDPRGIANALIGLGHNTQRQGQASAGLEFVEEGIKILQQIGDRAGVARGYLDIGRTCFYTGQFARGNAMWLKCFPILEDLGMHSELVYSTLTVNIGFAHNGEYSLAIAQTKQGLPLAQESDARREIAAGYMILGTAYLGQGDVEQAQAWALKSITQYQEIDQKDELGWALALMIFIERDFGRVDSARSYLCQTLEIGIKTHGYFSVLHGLCAAALLFLDQGEIERAVELYALVTRFPVAANSRWFQDVAGREISEAGKSLSPEVLAAAQERGKTTDIWVTASGLLDEFPV